MNIDKGVLYIVATPLGNLEDISLRAIDVLKKVDCIAAEDTRHSLPLLQHFSIKTPLISLHAHNERERVEQLSHRLKKGESIALITDAGTPLISDPGYVLVRDMRKSSLPVIPIPGACAAIAALSVSGLPTDRFIFEGFLPPKPKACLQRLEELSAEMRTLIFYESPHRISKVLHLMQTCWGGERRVFFARELTKVFETTRLTTLAELTEWVESDSNQQRGEIVLIVEGKPSSSPQQEQTTLVALQALLNVLPLKQAVDVAAKITKERKNKLYEMALKYKPTLKQ